MCVATLCRYRTALFQMKKSGARELVWQIQAPPPSPAAQGRGRNAVCEHQAATASRHRHFTL